MKFIKKNLNTTGPINNLNIENICKKLGNFDENIKYNAIDIFYDIKIKNNKNEHRKERVIVLTTKS